LLAKIEGLQRQIDELGRVADLDARFRELAERVDQLEKTNTLEARFTKRMKRRRTNDPDISLRRARSDLPEGKR
jgi:hypothetical protein